MLKTTFTEFNFQHKHIESSATDYDSDTEVAQGPTGLAVDQRRPNKTDDKLGRNDPASVYGGPGEYAFVSDRTGEVTQINDKKDGG